MTRPTRRRFLAQLGGAATALSLAPRAARASMPDLDEFTAALRALDPVDESFWLSVKHQFPLRGDLVLMNAGNLCPSPRPVIDAVARRTRDIDTDASFQNRARFDDLRDRARFGLARYLGAFPDEIAITRNTSEGNNTVINGLTLGRGDEVVIWDQNHPTCNVAWDVRAERFGFSVRRVSTPPAPTTAEELIEPFRRALSARTRVLAFSHVSNVSGVRLPARDLCRLAQAGGVLTLVDGAQVFGVLRLDLHDIGCDFYTGSAHKWFVGPKEVGILYVRRDRVANLWPSNVGVGWQGALEHGAAKFDNLGQRDDARVAAMGNAVGFHEAIGPTLVEHRVRTLVEALRRGIRERIPAAYFHTPSQASLSAGVVVLVVPSRDSRGLYEALYRDHAIAGAAMGGDFTGIRLCPHIYNTMEDVHRVAETIARIA